MKNLDIIKEIIDWPEHDEKTKLYYIQSYLLGWTKEEFIHHMTEIQKGETNEN